MRTSQLQALLKVLRAGGVSEYSRTHRGETVTLRLSDRIAPAADSKSTVSRSAAKTAQALPPISSAFREQIEALGVKPEDVEEVCRTAGIGWGVSDA